MGKWTVRFETNLRGELVKEERAPVNRGSADSLLACFEARIALADHKNLSTPANDLAVFVTLLC